MLRRRLITYKYKCLVLHQHLTVTPLYAVKMMQTFLNTIYLYLFLLQTNKGYLEFSSMTYLRRMYFAVTTIIDTKMHVYLNNYTGSKHTSFYYNTI